MTLVRDHYQIDCKLSLLLIICHEQALPFAKNPIVICDVTAYRSIDGKSTISRHEKHDDLNVWVYIRPDNPTVIVTVDPCPSVNSRWLQWDEVSGKYFTVELDKKTITICSSFYTVTLL